MEGIKASGYHYKLILINELNLCQLALQTIVKSCFINVSKYGNKASLNKHIHNFTSCKLPSIHFLLLPKLVKIHIAFRQSEKHVNLSFVLGYGNPQNGFRNCNAILSHDNPCFLCNIAVTNFLVSNTCEIRFRDAIDHTVRMYTS